MKVSTKFWDKATPVINRRKTKHRYSADQVIVAITLVISIAIFLFPPWEIKRGNHAYYPVGSHFILEPPVSNPRYDHFSRIDYKRLRYHYFALFSAAGLVYLLVWIRKKKSSQEEFDFD